MKKSFSRIWVLVYLTALAVPTFCFIAASLILFNQNELQIRVQDGSVAAQDFVHYYIFGRMAASPDAHLVYSEVAQSRWFHDLVLQITGFSTSQSYWCLFAPMVFPFCLPLALMSLKQAFIAFVILSALALFSCFPLALNALGKRSFASNAAIIFCLIANTQGLLSIAKGQPSFLLLALESLFFWGWIKRKDWVTGLAIGILFFKPHYGLFFVTPILMARRWKALLVCTLTTALLMFLGGLIIGFDNVINFPQIITQKDIGSCLGMVSLRYLATLYFPDLLALHISLGIMVVGLILNVIMWWQGEKHALDQTWLICCTTLICILASPHTYHYDLIMLGLLAVSIIPARSQQKPIAKVSYAAYRTLLIASPGLYWISILVLPKIGEVGSPYDPIQSIISIVLNFTLLALALVCLFDKPTKSVSETETDTETATETNTCTH